MEDVATTSEAPVETTSVSTETSTAATETADVSAERSEESPFDSVQIDINKVPEAARSVFEQERKSLEKQFKGAFTKKTQEYSERLKSTESELNRLRQQAVEFQQMLLDPQKAEAYRKLAGTPVEAEPQLETVGDLERHFEQKFERQFEQKARMFQAQQRWGHALNEFRAKEPELADRVAQIAYIDPKYRSLYNGSNEIEVLGAVHNDLLKAFQPKLEAAKKSVLENSEKKKAATTFAPGKSVETTGGARKLTPDEIIAKVNAMIPR